MSALSWCFAVSSVKAKRRLSGGRPNYKVGKSRHILYNVFVSKPIQNQKTEQLDFYLLSMFVLSTRRHCGQ